MKFYTADFETTTLETNSEETWVWSYGTRELFNPGSFRWGKDIDGFMKWCSLSPKEIYFHNLKFDGFFILNWLLKNGFTYNDERRAQPKTFKTIITKDTIFYQIEVCWDIKKKKVNKTVFKDSYKKLPFTVERIAKAFKLEFLKGDLDYTKIRPKGYEPTKEEIDYLFRDVEIMAQALEIQLNEGLEKMTIGSDSLNTFKTMLSKPKFDRYFPVLDSGTNELIRRSYKGGFTYVNPIHAGVDIYEGQVYDVNSLYPSVMYSKPMPYGLPIRFDGKYEPCSKYPLYVQGILCEFHLKEGYLPTMQIKGDFRFKSTEYLTTSDTYIDGIKHENICELYLTSVDYELFEEHYHVIIHDYIGGFKFKSITGIFNEYIEKFMEIKKKEKGAKRELAKLLLNNLYGKFATGTDATDKVPFLKHDGSVGLVVNQNPKEKESIYTAVGSYITSYAREITIRSAQALGDRFIYADTDSLHIVGTEPVNLDIDPVDLGKWKFEGEFTRGRFLRAKTYIEDICLGYVYDDNGNKIFDEEGQPVLDYCTIKEKVKTKTKITCAGMNDRIKAQVNFDNFIPGSKFEGKLTPKIINGGVVLAETTFSIKLS